MRLQLADISGRSGGYKNPSSVPFTAADVGQMTLWPQASVYLAINEDDDNNSTYLLECFVEVK